MIQNYKLGINDLDVVVNKVKSLVDNKDYVVLLRGDLASGKTTFVKRYVESMGLEDTVTSPTFSIQSVYGNDVFHYDVYNKSLEDFISLGLLEEFEKSGIHFVEWGDDRLKDLLVSYGFEVLNIKIDKLDDKRQYTIYA